jgi:hypothetical protein
MVKLTETAENGETKVMFLNSRLIWKKDIVATVWLEALGVVINTNHTVVFQAIVAVIKTSSIMTVTDIAYDLHATIDTTRITKHRSYRSIMKITIIKAIMENMEATALIPS